MTLDQAQANMREAYFGGAPGLLASSLMWAAAGFVAWQHSANQAVWTLFVGGMLIHPVAIVICKLLGRSAKHASTNRLGALAMETTIWLIVSCPLAYVVSRYRIDWFFPAMLLVIGGRYAVFATLYGQKLYWLISAILIASAYGLATMSVSPTTGAWTGAAIEFLFALVIFAKSKSEARA